MKRTYSKPDIAFESFSLCNSIAAGCAERLNLPYSGGCGVLFADVIIFLEGVTGCAVKVVDGSEEAGGLCYDIPVDAGALFDS